MDSDDDTPPGNLFWLLPSDEKARLCTNIATAMQGVPGFIFQRQVGFWVNSL